MITIYGELYSSKNSRRILRVKDRVIVAKSSNAKNQEVDFELQLNTMKQRFKLMTKNVLFPWKLQFKIYRRTHARFDYVNIIQGLLDAMVKAGLLPDDDAAHVLPVFAPFEIDKHNPRVEIRLQ